MADDEHPHRFTEEEHYHLPPQTVDLRHFHFPQGLVLDIGGGGEGIIGQILGRNAVAIDIVRRELEETQNDSLKIVMDAGDMKFLDGSFEAVTMFFSLMFIPPQDHPNVLSEVKRVLKPGGRLLIWDMTFGLDQGNNKPVFAFPLTVMMPNGLKVETGYGCLARDQSMKVVVRSVQEAGFMFKGSHREGDTYFLEFTK